MVVLQEAVLLVPVQLELFLEREFVPSQVHLLVEPDFLPQFAVGAIKLSLLNNL